MKRLLIGCLILLFAACAEEPGPTLPPLETEGETEGPELVAKFNESIIGRWVEDECRPVSGSGVLYSQRHFEFYDANRMYLIIQAYKDFECTEEHSKLVTGGPYSLSASSERRKQFELRLQLEPVFYQVYKGCTIANRAEPGTLLMEKWRELRTKWEKPLRLRVVGDQLQEIYGRDVHGPRLIRQTDGIFVRQ